MNINNRRSVIYLDNNATTQIDHRVLDAMMPFLTYEYANASSNHEFGLQAYEAVKLARKQVSDLIGAEPHEIVFTSGATESLNIAIKGVAENYQSRGKHIITVLTEHNAVLDTCKFLQTKGFEVTYLTVGKDGIIDIGLLKSYLREDTILVSVMMANNETGVLQPVKEICELTHDAGAIFLSDTTQAVGKIPVDVGTLGIDLLSISGHKIYAPKGVGALYVRQTNKRIKIPALFHGGGQEKGFRSGTLNVPGIVALGSACEIAKREMSNNEDKIRVLRDYLESEILKIEGTAVNGNIKNRLFNTSNILFKDADSDAIILGLSNLGNELPIIAVSNGSACTSTSINPSHVLTEMGLTEQDAYCSIRFSLGKNNNMEEVRLATKFIYAVVEKLRLMMT